MQRGPANEFEEVEQRAVGRRVLAVRPRSRRCCTSRRRHALILFLVAVHRPTRISGHASMSPSSEDSGPCSGIGGAGAKRRCEERPPSNDDRSSGSGQQMPFTCVSGPKKSRGIRLTSEDCQASHGRGQGAGPGSDESASSTSPLVPLHSLSTPHIDSVSRAQRAAPAHHHDSAPARRPSHAGSSVWGEARGRAASHSQDGRALP